MSFYPVMASGFAIFSVVKLEH